MDSKNASRRPAGNTSSSTPATPPAEPAATPAVDTGSAAPVEPAITPSADAAPADVTSTAKTDDVVVAQSGTYTVAPGRTVDGKSPGQTVELDDTDAQRMRELGFILGDDGSIVVRADGPAVNVENGVQVRTSA